MPVLSTGYSSLCHLAGWDFTRYLISFMLWVEVKKNCFFTSSFQNSIKETCMFLSHGLIVVKHNINNNWSNVVVINRFSCHAHR